MLINQPNMKTRTFIALFVSAVIGSAFAAPPAGPQLTVDVERLVSVYANLRNAEQMATGGVVLSSDDVKTAARAMSADALKKECGMSVDRTLAAISSGPTDRRPETHAYLKNAALRLIYNREERHGGHADWAKDNRDKVSALIRKEAKEIKEALAKL